MISEKQLWSRRRIDYWTMATKYLKLIGNSGFLFTIYLLFVFGSYYYGQFLQWLPETFPAVLFFTLVFMWLMTRGRVRTFVKQGDLFFLTPREEKMSSYFRSALHYSWLMETFYFALVFLLLAPLFFDRIHPSGSLLLSILLLLSGLKLWNLASGFQEQRVQEKGKYHVHTFIRLGINGVTVYALFSLQPMWFVVLLAGILAVFYYGYFYQLSKTHSVKWERLVEIEDQTVMTFYRIANSFTDVPQLKSKVRFRRWLSPLFKLVSFKKQHVYHYLFSRAFVRSNDYFGIYARLTLLGLLFISVVQLDWGRWLVIGLFAYMTAQQIETLKHHYATNKMVELYPLSAQSKFQSHQFWLLVLGAIQAVIFGTGALIFYNLMDMVIALFIVSLVYFYHGFIRLAKVYRPA
ncbi:ABC-2 type transport system permease protein [Evansella vedderi]|uniref:ABC-2 type transport system permease protein n=1 Tax=Evansella vedderi TaxID=38282 RepID=A0ABT9ZSR3_9BACI|nr:ABC transporter permease [Evansella vedderi]MDQ0254224.1 ABC-2 type transport system permease protein [Evansella vedderi]